MDYFVITWKGKWIQNIKLDFSNRRGTFRGKSRAKPCWNAELKNLWNGTRQAEREFLNWPENNSENKQLQFTFTVLQKSKQKRTSNKGTSITVQQPSTVLERNKSFGPYEKFRWTWYYVIVKLRVKKRKCSGWGEQFCSSILRVKGILSSFAALMIISYMISLLKIIRRRRIRINQNITQIFFWNIISVWRKKRRMQKSKTE